MDHPRPAEQRPVRVDDRRAVESALAVALVQVEHDDDAELPRAPAERVGRRTRNSFGTSPRGVGGRALRKEAFERELGKDDDRGALSRGPFERLEPAADVRGLVSPG